MILQVITLTWTQGAKSQGWQSCVPFWNLYRRACLSAFSSFQRPSMRFGSWALSITLKHCISSCSVGTAPSHCAVLTRPVLRFDPYDFIGHTKIIHDNVPISRSLTFSQLQSHLCSATYSQVLDIKTWIDFGSGANILPTTNCFMKGTINNCF